MYQATSEVMKRSVYGCVAVLVLLLATNSMVQGESSETIPCNDRNETDANQNTSCCLSSTTEPFDCPDGFLKLNKTSKNPCSNETVTDLETTTADPILPSSTGLESGDDASDAPSVDYDITVCVAQCPEGWISTAGNDWCEEIRCDNNCLTCSGNPSACTSCSENLELKDGKCTEKFPLAIVVGCAVGGGVVVMAVVIIICRCVRCKKGKKSDLSTNRVFNLSNSPNRCDEEEGSQSTDDDTYVNGPQKITGLSSSIQIGHDNVLRYTPDPTKQIEENKASSAWMREKKSNEELEIQSLPLAPLPPKIETGRTRNQEDKFVENVDNGTLHNDPRLSRMLRENDWRLNRDSGELYVNVENATSVTGDNASQSSSTDVYVQPQHMEEDYVNVENLAKGMKNTDTVDTSSIGGDSDQPDYENDEVIRNLKCPTDDIYANYNVH